MVDKSCAASLEYERYTAAASDLEQMDRSRMWCVTAVDIRRMLSRVVAPWVEVDHKLRRQAGVGRLYGFSISTRDVRHSRRTHRNIIKRASI